MVYMGWELTEVRWAATKDMKLDPWVTWNKTFKLPRWFWQRIWEYPFVFSKLNVNESVLDIGGTYPFVLFANLPNARSVDSRDLNSVGHYLHDNLWPAEKLIISDARKILTPDKSYDNVISISALEEMPEPEKVLNEMMRIASKKIILTCDVGGYGMQEQDFINLFANWRIKPFRTRKSLTSVNPILLKFGQRPIWKNRAIRVVGIVFDYR